MSETVAAGIAHGLDQSGIEELHYLFVSLEDELSIYAFLKLMWACLKRYLVQAMSRYSSISVRLGPRYVQPEQCTLESTVWAMNPRLIRTNPFPTGQLSRFCKRLKTFSVGRNLTKEGIGALVVAGGSKELPKVQSVLEKHPGDQGQQGVSNLLILLLPVLQFRRIIFITRYRLLLPVS